MNWLSAFYETHPEYRKLRHVLRKNVLHFELERGLYETRIGRGVECIQTSRGWWPRSGLTETTRIAQRLIRNPVALARFVAMMPFGLTFTDPGTVTTSMDSFMRVGNPNTNYGGATTFNVGAFQVLGDLWDRALLEFNVSSIPAGSTVTAATLDLWLDEPGNTYASNNRTMTAYRVKRAWVEAQVTWNVYSTGNSWQTAGCAGALDAEASGIGTHDMATTDADNSKHTLTLSNAGVQGWISGALANNGLKLQMATEYRDAYVFKSSDHATSAQRPLLTVNYTLPTSGYRPLLGVGT